MKTTWGVLDPPVGNTRLNVVRLVASLLQSNTHSINTELINLNTLGVILVSTIYIFMLLTTVAGGIMFLVCPPICPFHCCEHHILDSPLVQSHAVYLAQL